MVQDFLPFQRPAISQNMVLMFQSLKKMTVLEEEPGNLKQMDTLLTWGQVGIGCQTFLIDFLKILIKNQVTKMK